MEAGADDNATYDFLKLFKEAGQKDSLSAEPPTPFSFEITLLRSGVELRF